MINKISLFVILFIYMSIFLSLSFVYCKHALQMFQQNHYELYRYAKWLFNRNNLHYSLTIIYSMIVLLVGIVFKGKDLLIILISIVFAIIFLYQESKKTYIKDLVLTNRVKRQISNAADLAFDHFQLIMNGICLTFRQFEKGLLCISSISSKANFF